MADVPPGRCRLRARKAGLWRLGEQPAGDDEHLFKFRISQTQVRRRGVGRRLGRY